jgi:NAD(P)-dependent dehydrogenase (short-subunit alcohol dehydrogenase family)
LQGDHSAGRALISGKFRANFRTAEIPLPILTCSGRSNHRNDPHETSNADHGFIKEFNMVGWVVLVTGALTGLGRAAAIALAKEGAIVIAAGRHEEAGAELVSQLRAFGQEAEFVKADVRKEDDVRAMIDHAVARFGRLDVAVNNAGTEGVPGPVTQQTPESYTTVFDTNVLGILLCMKHELRVMQSQGFGNLVNISSTMGSRGAANASLYVASKHAVEGLTKSGALEAAAFGVRVNAVAPGPVETAMLDRFTGSEERKAGLLAGVPLRRAGRPEEVADAILFLASNKASFITGQIIRINGGKTAS